MNKDYDDFITKELDNKISDAVLNASSSIAVDSSSLYGGTVSLDSCGTISLDPSAFRSYTSIYSHPDITSFCDTSTSDEEKMLLSLIQAIPFDQLDSMVKDTISLSELDSDEGFDQKEFVKLIVKTRVCPEEFLLEYFDYLEPSEIKIHHSQLLLEKKYPALLLKLKVEGKGKK